jgi:glycosyltransferase involved in cell wall biosynthesis
VTVTSTDASELLKPISLRLLPEMPLVSVLITNFNYAAFVGRAIDSVLGQSYGNFEVIVCDDGSGDNSWEVIQTYVRHDPRVRGIRQVNGGQGAALSSTLGSSKGEVVCILDSDDTCTTNRLQIVVDAFRNNPQSGLLMHGLYLIDSQGHRCGVIPLFRRLPSGWLGPSALSRGGDMTWMVTTSSGLCFRRQIIETAAPLARDFRISADCGVFSVAILMTPMIGLSLPLGSLCEHGSNNLTTSVITPAYLERHAAILQQAWNAQRSYLCSIDSRLSHMLSPLDTGLWVPMMRYIGASFRGESRRLTYRALMSNESFSGLPFLTRWFWKTSILVPHRLFARAIRLLWGRHWLREWVTWLVMLYRAIKRGLESAQPVVAAKLQP